MLAYSVFFAVSALVCLVGFLVFGTRITFKELLLQLGIALIVSGALVGISYCQNTGDFELWNSRIVKKDWDTRTVIETYSCNCHSTKNGTSCSICTRTYPVWDWWVNTSIGERVYIEYANRWPGAPSRWKQVRIGEPSSTEHHYTNYIKAAPDSIFRSQGQIDTYREKLPKHPGVHDVYRTNRLIEIPPVQGENLAEWNEVLGQLNADLGPKHQANILVVLTREPPEYFYALRQHWVGGKKNDIVVVAGIDQDKKPQWIETMALDENPMFGISVRDQLMVQGTITPQTVDTVLRNTIPLYYKRKPMKDFSYLVEGLQPKPWQWVVGLIVCLLTSCATTWWVRENDVV